VSQAYLSMDVFVSYRTLNNTTREGLSLLSFVWHRKYVSFRAGSRPYRAGCCYFEPGL